jgi:hypothetical protein
MNTKRERSAVFALVLLLHFRLGISARTENEMVLTSARIADFQVGANEGIT